MGVHRHRVVLVYRDPHVRPIVLLHSDFQCLTFDLTTVSIRTVLSIGVLYCQRTSRCHWLLLFNFAGTASRANLHHHSTIVKHQRVSPAIQRWHWLLTYSHPDV